MVTKTEQAKKATFRETPINCAPDFGNVEANLTLGELLDLTRQEAAFIDAGLIEHLLKIGDKVFSLQHDNTKFKTFFIVISREDLKTRFSLIVKDDITSEAFQYERA